MNLVVLFGGNSVEHEISIISAQQAIASLKDSKKYNLTCVYLSKQGEFYYSDKDLLSDVKNFKDLEQVKKDSKRVTFIKNKNDVELQLVDKKFGNRVISSVDVVMPIVHGTNVEDGTIAGYFNLLDVPFVFSKHMAAVISQDKVFQKQILEANNIPVVDYTWVYDYEVNLDIDKAMDKVETLGYPVIIKPNTLGSSVGIQKAKNRDELEIALTEAIKFDNKILVEKMLGKIKEINIGVRGDYQEQQVSKTEEVGSEDEFLTFSDKYQSGGSKKSGSKQSSAGMASLDRIIPANVETSEIELIENIAKKTFSVVGNSGLIRIDFIKDLTTNTIYLNEINSIPGSLSYYLWEATGVDFQSLLDDLIKQAITDYKNKSKLQFSFDSNVLSLQAK